ncbi:hypothetical protein KEM55_001826 [Ascosphaera atra]|nr:hypothetical protein KEM55_001826 [Ascosphaera atra]
MENDTCVGEVRHIRGLLYERRAYAHLRVVAEDLAPIMAHMGWYISVLSEYLPVKGDPNILSSGRGKHMRIWVQLRLVGDVEEFINLKRVLYNLIEEMCRIEAVKCGTQFEPLYREVCNTHVKLTWKNEMNEKRMVEARQDVAGGRGGRGGRGGARDAMIAKILGDVGLDYDDVVSYVQRHKQGQVTTHDLFKALPKLLPKALDGLDGGQEGGPFRKEVRARDPRNGDRVYVYERHHGRHRVDPRQGREQGREHGREHGGLDEYRGRDRDETIDNIMSKLHEIQRNKGKDNKGGEGANPAGPTGEELRELEAAKAEGRLCPKCNTAQKMKGWLICDKCGHLS